MAQADSILCCCKGPSGCRRMDCMLVSLLLLTFLSPADDSSSGRQTAADWKEEQVRLAVAGQRQSGHANTHPKAAANTRVE